MSFFHSRLQHGLFSYLRKFSYFSHFITRYKDLVFQNKTFCFVINLSREKAWNHTVQTTRARTNGDPAGEVQLQNRSHQPTWGCHCKIRNSCLRWGLQIFPPCLGNFRVEVRMPQPTDFSNTVQESWNISDYQILGFQSAPEVLNSRNNFTPLSEEVTSGD